MGFTPSLLKKRMAERCSSLVHVASGVAIFTLLLRRRVAFPHRTATCRPLFKPSVLIFFHCIVVQYNINSCLKPTICTIHLKHFNVKLKM